MTKKVSVTKILLFLVIFSLENFACLLPASEYIVPGFIKYGDIPLFISVVFILWVALFVKFKDKNKKAIYPYKWIVIGFILLIIVSSIMSFHFFRQPISWGIRSQRMIITCFLLYFSISKALQTGVINKSDLIKDILIVGTIEMVLFTIQYILANKLIFLNFTSSDLVEMRLEHRRLRFPTELLFLVTFIRLDNLLNNRGSKIKNISYIIWFFLILVIMVQKRIQIIAFIITIIIIFALWRKKLDAKLLINLIIILVVGLFMINSPIIQSSYDGLTNRNGSNDTISIRESGIKYYKERVKNSIIFGFGKPNSNSKAARKASGELQRYYLADDGIYGFLYIFGLSGIIWLILFWKNNIKKSWKLYKIQYIYIYISYFIYESIGLYIEMKWYYYWHIAIVLAFTLMDYDYNTNKSQTLLVEESGSNGKKTTNRYNNLS